ncbi:peptidyl-prolyl cis-trans isomerase [Bacillus sp. CGMCC 1.16607]|uniref:peptidyl-prolyl cis-trans isomerase n=1 Tax=Bacillus sp. CGMCC 1.16607 TaxID=3351842 RepID=UPI00363DD134
MEKIVMIKGKVKYTITLDPGVWIFDDRKVDLDSYFQSNRVDRNELEEYTKEMSSHWDREIIEGAALPTTKISEKTFIKEQIITGSFGIPLKPFLLTASPLEDAKKLSITTENQSIEVDLSAGYELLLGFSNKGKPLYEDGPIHIYFGDGSNQNQPITNVREICVL